MAAEALPIRGALRLAALIVGVCALLGQPARAQDRTVNFYNWSNYMAPGVLDEFTRETGIKVVYDTFDANETLETRLLAGKSGYDVVVPTAYFLQRQIAAHIFQKLDKSKLPNLHNAWDVVTRQLAVYDPGNQYAANYMWGTTGIGYNVDAVRRILGPDGAIDSWDMIFKPENLAKFKDCGVHMLDSADDILPAALNYLHLDPNSTKPADLDKAAELVGKVRPFVRKFHSSEYLSALATGEICLVVGWSGDIKQAQRRAAEANNGIHIGYAIPKEGAQMFFDNLAIPADAPHVEEAHELINFLYRPEIAARNSNFLAYANGNLASKKLIDPKVIGDKTIYPDAAMQARLFIITARDAAAQRIINRLWIRVKTGR
ncbi:MULTISPECIES: polyamine ABC transporter substrate-binding protein [Rhodopseudomonas]|uniref:Putrescine-binding periplasmic protein n=1 Tax=Rhodopseudomonas palustris TaxID=1076 RepID=A0A0D7F3U6_RHOPL|nr:MULTISPECIES: polyamine ABC transporter substrate-binding protein [Rhodopseudomonas]KIZ46432.1 spermidine/putrescine ABC transporter substrate-binding protein [Rhodopseudomonas palustris]MDF3810155.1 polyamine ABC transporter substrate-binding protein [Rhodopseudomonas sp. BAL398]WOK19795.1 polyamine ABC transporter substrate-binding protein [Rhodopseudomonas sp. BAL398]